MVIVFAVGAALTIPAGTGDGNDDDSDGEKDDGCPSTIYAYDSLSRLTSETDALGRVTAYAYDAASQLTQRTDARGLVTKYFPDALGRLNRLEHWAGTLVDSVSYSYDAVGNRTQMVGPTGTTTYAYDPLNRLTSVTFPGSSVVSYDYNEVGDLTRITYPSTNDVDYTYDEGHRMETVTDWLANQTVYTYDDAGRLDLAELPNGVDADYVYDAANRLTDLTNTGPGPTTISDYHYELDAAGNRTEMTDLSGTHEYVYDALYRLTEVTYPDPETDAYTYDANGNRLTKDSDDYTYDAADQLTDLEGVTYGYDENGNQTDRDTDTFVYDHENRLIEAVINSVTSTSEYNGDGLRMSLTVDDGSPVTTEYAWDVNRSLPSVVDDGTNQYVYGLNLVAAIDGSDNEVFFTYDGLGSTTDLTDGSATVTDQYTYDVFGAARSHTGSSPNYWQFTGEQTDADSGLQYLRARYYDATTGRFISRDPAPAVMSRPSANNAYSYVGNNPASWVDPSGLWCPKDPSDCVPGPVKDAVSWGAGVAASVYQDPLKATIYLDGLAATIDIYAAVVVDTSLGIGCTLGPGGCAAGYISGYFFMAPALAASNLISAGATAITCADWMGLIGGGNKEGASFTDCAISTNTAVYGWFLPEPNLNAALASYQFCYDTGGCDAWWNYKPNRGWGRYRWH